MPTTGGCVSKNICLRRLASGPAILHTHSTIYIQPFSQKHSSFNESIEGNEKYYDMSRSYLRCVRYGYFWPRWGHKRKKIAVASVAQIMMPLKNGLPPKVLYPTFLQLYWPFQGKL